MLQPVTQESVTHRVVDQLVRLIRDTPLRPGHKLPSEKELMAALNVSRPTVREALQVLGAMGLVESRRGQGTFVSQARAEYAIRPEVLSLLLLQEDAREIQYARKIIESDIAATMIEKATPEDYELLEDVLARMDRALEHDESIYELTWDFHRTLGEIAGNGVLKRLLDVLYQMIHELQIKFYEPRIDPRGEVESHRRLLHDLRSATPDEGRRLIQEHLDDVEVVMRSAMKDGRL